MTVVVIEERADGLGHDAIAWGQSRRDVADATRLGLGVTLDHLRRRRVIECDAELEEAMRRAAVGVRVAVYVDCGCARLAPPPRPEPPDPAPPAPAPRAGQMARYTGRPRRRLVALALGVVLSACGPWGDASVHWPPEDAAAEAGGDAAPDAEAPTRRPR